MVQEYQIRVQPQIAYNEQSLTAFLSKEKGFDSRTINSVRILRRSIDARQRQVMVNLKVRVYINELPQDEEYQRVEYPDVSDAPQVIVVGAGPGGLFAALHLIELGYRPVIVERGKDVRERKKDMAAITRNQCVDHAQPVRRPREQLLLWRRRRRSLLRRKTLHAQQEARQRGENPQRLLPARGLHIHSVRCTSPYRHGQVATSH